MASRKSTNVSLFVLGLVSLGVVGYFIWLFLAPPPPAAVVPPVFSTDIQTGVVESSNFQQLQPYANLPIRASGAGRVNPFLPYDVTVSSTNNPAPETNVPKSPIINTPPPPPPNLNNP